MIIALPSDSIQDAIDDLPPLREVISAHSLRAEKSLGQNFLLDQNLTDKIVRQSSDLSGKTVIEIGPGPGGLTRSLLKSDCKKVIALEYDPRAVEALQSLKTAAGDKLEIVQKDALEADLLSLFDGPRVIVANLPYNIATPLLIRWLKNLRDLPGSYDEMLLMFQKEVAMRICAVPRTKAYGRLSVISQWLCDVRPVMELPPSAFTPPPKIKSSVVRFIPKTLESSAPNFASVEAVTQKAFGQRRKMIRSSLKDYAAFFEGVALSGEKRAEELRVEDFVNLAKQA